MTVGSKIGTVFAIAVVLLAVVAGSAYVSVQRLLEANRWVVHTHQVREKLDDLSRALVDAEASQRGYLLSGEGRYRELYQGALRRIGPDIDAVASLTADNPAQEQSLRQVRTLADARQAALDEAIRLRREGVGLQGAALVAHIDHGRKIMDDIQDVLTVIMGREQSLLKERTAAAAAAASHAVSTSAVWTPLALVVLAVAAVVLVRTIPLGGATTGSVGRAQRAVPVSPDDYEPSQPRSLPAALARIALRYASAAIVVAVAVLLQRHLVHAFGPMPLFIMFYPAVLLVAIVGGGGPGIAATVLSALAADYWFILPYGTLRIDAPHDALALGIFTATGLCLSLLAEQLRRTRWAEALGVAQQERAEELAEQNEELAQQAEELSQQNEELAQQSEELAQQSEELSRHNEELARQAALIDLSPDGIMALRGDRTILRWGRGAEALYGWSKEEAIGRNLDELLATQFPQPLQQICRQLEQTGRWSGELRHTTRDGRQVVVLSRWLAHCDGQGNIVEVLESNVDITERKKAAEELRCLYAEQQTIFDAVPAMIWHKDTKNNFVRVNRAVVQAVGKPLSEIEGESACEVFPDEAQHYYEDDLQVIRSGLPRLGIVEPMQTVSGEKRWVETDKIPYRDAQGNITGVLVFSVDVTERRQRDEQLRAAQRSAEHAKSIAEQANRAKDHFLAVLSHELRTPLTPVVMGVSMLQDQRDLSAASQELLEMIRRNVEMEARLIDDLLDVSRIVQGKIELHRSPVELCTIIRRAVEVCQPDIQGRRLQFGVDLGPAAPYWVDADVSRLQQVFWNLLKNAIKFTPQGGCVGLRCRPDEGDVLVEITDSGIGIEPDALSRVFDAFEQAERSITREFGGLGLGLAISKALVELHGGSISGHSAGRGQGATFRIRLPLTAPAGQTEQPAPPKAPAAAIRPLQILMAEDHGVTAKIMQLVLTQEGHAVVTVGDVTTAIERAGQHRFDLLFSDLGLPDGSGHDLLRELRARGHAFPAIALSGYGQENDIRRSREAGFAAHLTKPASREALVKAIAAVMKQRG